MSTTYEWIPMTHDFMLMCFLSFHFAGPSRPTVLYWARHKKNIGNNFASCEDIWHISRRGRKHQKRCTFRSWEVCSNTPKYYNKPYNADFSQNMEARFTQMIDNERFESLEMVLGVAHMVGSNVTKHNRGSIYIQAYQNPEVCFSLKKLYGKVVWTP